MTVGAARFLVSVVLPRAASRALRSAALHSASPAAMALRATLDSARSSTGEKRAGGRGRNGGPGKSAINRRLRESAGVCGARSRLARTPGRLSDVRPVAGTWWLVADGR
ncbi:hypothetical protein GCM10010294_02690 [Streptomyces griseoloalbus]|nr:hypothetical protein GCM10010294_02690 [Streptomyces griseoloalbus]